MNFADLGILYVQATLHASHEATTSLSIRRKAHLRFLPHPQDTTELVQDRTRSQKLKDNHVIYRATETGLFRVKLHSYPWEGETRQATKSKTK